MPPAAPMSATYAPHRVRLATPVGMIEVVGDESVITRLTILAETDIAPANDAPVGSPVAHAAQQLFEYFAGVRHTFDLPLSSAATVRGAALRAAIASVPYGSTLSYGALARLHASAPRAMGQACARNPFPIIIPCHRVTSAAGARENYSGGNGVVTKSWLNAHEARHSRAGPLPPPER